MGSKVQLVQVHSRSAKVTPIINIKNKIAKELDK